MKYSITLLFASVKSIGQPSTDNYVKIQTLLNKAKGKIFTSEYNSEKKIGKQTFTSVSASFTEDGITKNHRTYISNYNEVDWWSMTWYFG